MKTNIIGFLKVMSVALFLVCGLGAMANEAQTKSSDASTSAQKANVTQQVDINTASIEELVSLPRVGPVIAQRIVEFRQEHGGFKRLEELMNVKGIGVKTFENLKSLIRISTPASKG